MTSRYKGSEGAEIPLTMEGASGQALDDPRRLAALYQLGVLDTESEEVFDRITRLASRVLGTPVVLLSLVDHDRQFFKSLVGLKEPWASVRETPLSHSFCQHVVTSGRPLVVDDARTHPLVRDNLAIRDLDVAAYAGMPLVVQDGMNIGSFCAIDSSPRHWSEEELLILEEFSALVTEELELRLRDARVLAVYANITEVVMLVDQSGTIGFVSGAVWPAIGRPVEELVGTRAIDLIHPDDQGQVANAFAATLAEPGVGPLVDARLAGEDGACRWFELALINRTGEPSVGAVVITAREITAWKAQHLELIRLAAIVASSESAIYSKSMDGIITSWNPAAERLFGYTSGEIIGQSIELLLSAGQQDDADGYMAAIRRGERVKMFDAQRRTKDASIIDVSLTISPIYDNDIIGFSTIATDISERQRAESMMADALDQQRAANAELGRVSQAQREFITVVSHEFRTPLTSIQGFSEMMRDEELDAAEIRDYADEIHRSAERLARMIGEMLDLDRMQSGKMSLSRQPVDLNGIVRDVARSLKVVSEHHELRLELDPSLPVIKGDPDRLVQVVTNLVRNGINYSPAGKSVVIKTYSTERSVHVSVCDEGFGIPADQLEAIFDRYTRVESGVKRPTTGTGLGLPIVKQIVELHGGHIAVESVLGEGTTFDVRLPTSNRS